MSVVISCKPNQCPGNERGGGNGAEDAGGVFRARAAQQTVTEDNIYCHTTVNQTFNYLPIYNSQTLSAPTECLLVCLPVAGNLERY